MSCKISKSLYSVIESRIATQERAIEARIDRVEDHQDATNAAQDRARLAGQKRTRLAMFAIAVTLIVLAIGIVFVAATLKAHGL